MNVVLQGTEEGMMRLFRTVIHAVKTTEHVMDVLRG
jgi:hypothetical protein